MFAPSLGNWFSCFKSFHSDHDHTFTPDGAGTRIEFVLVDGENAAKLYGFDLDALRPAANAANLAGSLGGVWGFDDPDSQVGVS